MALTIDDKNKIKKYYNEALEENPGDYAKGVHWSSMITQYSRFKELSLITNLNNQKILDVGSGNGELYKFFQNMNINVNYTGIELVEEQCNIAKTRFPAVKFINADFLEHNFNNKYDYALASGVFNNQLSNNKSFLEDSIKKMISLSRKGIAFNLLLKGTHPEDIDHVTYSINEIKDLISRLGYEIHVKQDYLPFDFTVYIYK
jgi:cyclopropane fatty-acyl-phospholipid synthase-like methyltransferase